MPSRNRFPEIIAALPKAVEEAVLAGAEKVAESARGRVPKVTGRLRDAIHVEPTEDGALVVAGDKHVFYGNLVEHGGATNRAPHPFLVPALEENRAEIEAEIAKAVRRAAE